MSSCGVCGVVVWSCGVELWCGVVVWSCFWGFWCQSQDLSFGLLWLPPHNHRVKIKAKAPSSTVLPPPTPNNETTTHRNVPLAPSYSWGRVRWPWETWIPRLPPCSGRTSTVAPCQFPPSIGPPVVFSQERERENRRQRKGKTPKREKERKKQQPRGFSYTGLILVHRITEVRKNVACGVGHVR